MERNFRPSSDFNSYNSSQLKKDMHINAMNPNKKQKMTKMFTPLPSHLIEISIWQDGELLLDGLQESDSNIKTIVCIVSKLSCMLHCSKWTTSLCLNIIGSSRMPSATKKKKPMKRHMQCNYMCVCPIMTFLNHMFLKTNCLVHLRQSEHKRCTVPISNESSQFPLAFLNCLLVLLTNTRIQLSHVEFLSKQTKRHWIIWMNLFYSEPDKINHENRNKK